MLMLRRVQEHSEKFSLEKKSCLFVWVQVRVVRSKGLGNCYQRYEGCPKSNASYFMMAHITTDECWQYGGRC